LRSWPAPPPTDPVCLAPSMMMPARVARFMAEWAARSAARKGWRETSWRWPMADTSAMGTNFSSATGAKAANSRMADPVTTELAPASALVRALAPKHSAPTITGLASNRAPSTSARRLAQWAVAGQTRPDRARA